MNPDHERLARLQTRLREFELQLPLPHERGIVEIARQALRDQIQALSRRLHEHAYWRTRADDRLTVA
jgi:rhamnogalacturonyl hydrolase YesR